MDEKPGYYHTVESVFVDLQKSVVCEEMSVKCVHVPTGHILAAIFNQSPQLFVLSFSVLPHCLDGTLSSNWIIHID